MPQTRAQVRPEPREVVAAGAVVFRPGLQVLLVHRPKYDDWSFPKGKLDPGEHATVAAVREVAEESGLRVRLTRPLGDQRYPVERGVKRVHYWIGRLVDEDAWDVSGYVANEEIDQVAWMSVDKAAEVLTYPRDRATLTEAVDARKRTHALVVLRHAQARSRREWSADDRLRPLSETGRRQSEVLADVLAAYGVRRVVTSPSTRCVETVQPFLDRTDTLADAEADDLLSEEGADSGPVSRLLQDLVADLPDRGSTVVCSHRPVLPHLLATVGLGEVALEKGEMAVLHVRKGRVRAVERHLPR